MADSLSSAMCVIKYVIVLCENRDTSVIPLVHVRMNVATYINITESSPV